MNMMPLDRRGWLRLASVMVLLAGVGCSIWIYRSAADASGPVLGYREEGGVFYEVRPDDSKTYLRDMELYGGKANVIAYEFRSWLAGLFHGRSLAVLVFAVAALASLAMHYVADRLPPREPRNGPGTDGG